MKKLLTLIFSIGMCFASFGCGNVEDIEDSSYESQNTQSSQQTTENKTSEESIEDICDLSNEQMQELAKEIRKESVYSISYGDNHILAERLKVSQVRTLYNKDCAALEEAKNARTVRVFNAETGQFEMQVDERKVKEAENQVSISYNLLNAAILNSNTTIEGATYGKIVYELESFTATTVSLRLILLNSLEYYEKLPVDCMQYSYFPEYSSNMPSWIKDITKIVKDFCGVQL